MTSSRLVLALAFMTVLGGCALVGPDDEAAERPPSEIEHDGLLFRLHAELSSDGEDVIMSLSVENVSDTLAGGEFPLGCMFGNRLAYDEGEWDEPVWRIWRLPYQVGCTTDAVTFGLQPGETRSPWGTLTTPVSWILGDSLDAGLYRLGAKDVEVDGAFGGFSPEMVAAEPVRLEAVP